METLTEEKVSREVKEAAKAYASSRFEWHTTEWDIARSSFEAGAYSQKPIEHKLKPINGHGKESEDNTNDL
jgi:hypothetical protein